MGSCLQEFGRPQNICTTRKFHCSMGGDMTSPWLHRQSSFFSWLSTVYIPQHLLRLEAACNWGNITYKLPKGIDGSNIIFSQGDNIKPVENPGIKDKLGFPKHYRQSRLPNKSYPGRIKEKLNLTQILFYSWKRRNSSILGNSGHKRYFPQGNINITARFRCRWHSRPFI